MTRGNFLADLAFSLASNPPTLILTKEELALMFDAALKLQNAYGYSLDTEICWHGEPKALCKQCTS